MTKQEIREVEEIITELNKKLADDRADQYVNFELAVTDARDDLQRLRDKAQADSERRRQAGVQWYESMV